MVKAWSMALVVAALPGAAGAADIAGTRAAIDRSLDAQYPHLEAVYKDIHIHPELGFQEDRTAAKLAGEMKALGYEVTEGRVHVHDLQATVLHQMGLEHTRLTYRFQGRDFRLTDVHGNVVREILA